MMGGMKQRPAVPSNPAPPDPLIKGYGPLQQWVPLDRSTLFRMVGRGAFPAPLFLTPRRPAWRQSAVEQWLAERAEAGR